MCIHSCLLTVSGFGIDALTDSAVDILTKVHIRAPLQPSELSGGQSGPGIR